MFQGFDLKAISFLSGDGHRLFKGKKFICLHLIKRNSGRERNRAVRGINEEVLEGERGAGPPSWATQAGPRGVLLMVDHVTGLRVP